MMNLRVKWQGMEYFYNLEFEPFLTIIQFQVGKWS